MTFSKMQVRMMAQARRGLTLIELVIVVAILAILAGFIVPRLGFIRNLAAEAGNSTIIADSANQVVLFNTAIGHYPIGEDTLLNSAGTLYANLDPKLSAVLTVLDLSTDSGAAKSLVGQLDPNSTSFLAYAHDETAGIVAGNSGTISQTITKTAGKVAKIKVPTALTDASYPIYQAAYGSAKLDPLTGAPLDNTFLVAFGYGPNLEVNGKTGLEAPSLFTKDPTRYNRPIITLKVFPTGSTAGNGTVPPGTNAATSISLGQDATTVNAQLAKYTVDQNR